MSSPYLSSPGFDRATQYAAASRSTKNVSGILDHPPSRVMTAGKAEEARQKTGCKGCQSAQKSLNFGHAENIP
jgi:hypothetical protein